MFEDLQFHALTSSFFAHLVANPAALLVVCAIGLCLWAALSDLRRFLIPNGVSACLALGGVMWIWVSNGPWLDHMLAFSAVLALGFGAFSLRLLGAGDAKLLAVLALWFGPYGAALLIFNTALYGAVLAIAWMLSGPARQALIGCGLAIDPLPTQRIPYGIAIAAAAIPALMGLWPSVPLLTA